MDIRGIMPRFLAGAEDVSVLQNVQMALGATHRCIQLTPDAIAPEVRNEWKFTSTPSIYLNSAHRDNFTITSV